MSKKRVLFVCMGNICRSPAAEGIFKHILKEDNLDHSIECDSAGTIGYHAGKHSDPRMRETARKRGYALESRARQVVPEDLEEFDLVLTMDSDNYADVLQLCETDEHRSKVKKMCAYCEEHDVDDVPDPYYGGQQGFDRVMNILEDACMSLKNSLAEECAPKT